MPYRESQEDGSEMLIQQGVLAFDYFTDHKYDLNIVEEAMRRALIKS